MQFLAKISNLASKFNLSLEKKQAVQYFSLTDDLAWQKFFGLKRRNTRIYYDSESAFTAYRAHELVYACVNKIADVMNDAEIIVEEKSKDNDWKKKEGHALPALFKRPNPNQTGRDIRRLLVQSEQGIGRFFIYIERSNAGIPVEISVLNPTRVVAKTNKNTDELTGYEYIRKDGRRIPLKTEDLLIRRRPDLLDQFYGFAPLEAALKSINSDLGLTDYVDAFFESDGTPSGILKILNRTVSDTRKKEIQEQWQGKYSRGGSNQKGLAVLDQDADYQKIGSNLDELASDSLSDRFESRICAVFGVPPNLVGAGVGLRHVTANATARAELRNLWDNKISPELAGLREWLTWFVLPEFEDIEAIRAEKIRVAFDISQVAFLQEELNDIHQRARENLRAGGWTLNEFREATGKPPDPDGDYYIQPVNLLSISPDNRATGAFEKRKQGSELTDGQTAADDEETAASEAEKAKLLACNGNHPEKKTFELDGLTLAREPRGVETVISLKTIAEDLETEKEKATRIFTRFRDELISQAADGLEKLTSETAYSLTLQPDKKTVKQIRKTLGSAYQRGRDQVRDELEAQRQAKWELPLEFKDERDELDDDEFLDELTDLTVSKIINEIQRRAIDWYTTLRLLLDYTVEKLKEKLSSESIKFIEQMAGNAVNAGIRTGRDAEIEANSEKIEHVEYSAILDVNTCLPCADADGQIADSVDELPPAPNPDCEGGSNCRCFHVAVII